MEVVKLFLIAVLGPIKIAIHTPVLLLFIGAGLLAKGHK